MSCPLSQPEKDALGFFLDWMYNNDVQIIRGNSYLWFDKMGKPEILSQQDLIEKYNDYQS